MQPFAALPTSPTDPIPAALPATQCLLLISEAHRRMAAAGGAAGTPLLELTAHLHFWERLEALIHLGQYAPFRSLLLVLLEALCDGHEGGRLSNLWVPPALPALLAMYTEVGPSHVEALRALMLNSISKLTASDLVRGAGAATRAMVPTTAGAAPAGAALPPGVNPTGSGEGGSTAGWVHGPLVFMWASLLAPAATSSAGCAEALDTLAHLVFASGDVAMVDSPLHTALAACQLTRRQVVHFLTSRRVWLAYAAVTAHSPQLPADVATAAALAATSASTSPLDAAWMNPSMADPRRGLGGKKGAGGGSSDDKRTTLLSAGTISSSGGGADALSDAWGLSTAPLQLPSVTAAAAAAAATSGAAPGPAGAFAGTAQYSDMGSAVPIDGAAVAASSLGLCLEMAIALDRDTRALLFWERFFTLYFLQAESSREVPHPHPSPRPSPLALHPSPLAPRPSPSPLAPRPSPSPSPLPTPSPSPSPRSSHERGSTRSRRTSRVRPSTLRAPTCAHACSTSASPRGRLRSSLREEPFSRPSHPDLTWPTSSSPRLPPPTTSSRSSPKPSPPLWCTRHEGRTSPAPHQPLAPLRAPRPLACSLCSWTSRWTQGW